MLSIRTRYDYLLLDSLMLFRLGMGIGITRRSLVPERSGGVVLRKCLVDDRREASMKIVEGW